MSQFASIMTQLTIPPSQRGLYKQFLLNRDQEITGLVDTLLKEQKEIRVSLSSLSTEESKPVKLFDSDEIVVYENGYIPKWTFVKKIKFILTLKEKWLTARQIADVIINELEYELWINKSKKEKDALYSTLSSTLTNNSKEGKEFVKKQNEIDENIYYIREK